MTHLGTEGKSLICHGVLTSLRDNPEENCAGLIQSVQGAIAFLSPVTEWLDSVLLKEKYTKY